MNSQLLYGVSGKDKEEVKRVVQNVLTDVGMDHIRKAVERQKREAYVSDYDCPSWAAKQAHFNGYNQALEDVLILLKG